jgi:GNAT superfamily N-acetyltransferase
MTRPANGSGNSGEVSNLLIYECVTGDDCEALSELYRRYLNGGETVERWLREGLRTPGYLGVKCIEDGEIIGVVSCRPGIEFTCGHSEIAREIERKWGSGAFYTADMGVVVPHRRGMGIARRLMEMIRVRLTEAGCEYIVTELWLRSRRFGTGYEDSQIIHAVEKYWGKCICVGTYSDFYRDLSTYGMTCPHCGAGECQCSAMVCLVPLGKSGATAPPDAKTEIETDTGKEAARL